MSKYVPSGPRRYAHQLKALRKIIETKGVCALLMEPGTGKSAVTLDYLSMLALKAAEAGEEVRALIVSPKAAVDNWVLQAETFVHEDVNVWAEALGGSIRQKAQTLANRGPQGYEPREWFRKKDKRQAQYRALNADRAPLLYVRNLKQPGKPVHGPGELPTPRLIIESINLEAFSSRDRVGSKTMADIVIEGVTRFDPHIVVCDESHRIKGVSSNSSRLMARIGRQTQRRLILTGTPMAHSPMDIFAQWRFLQPTAFGRYDSRTGGRTNATFSQFQRRYGVMGGFMGREVVSYQNLDEMQERMAHNSIVVRKEDALDLPELTQAVIPFTLAPKEERAYEEMKKTLATTLSSETVAAPNRLTQMLRLRQITAGFLSDSAGAVEQLGESKVDVIRSLAHDTLEGEDRIVIFATFRAEIELLKQRLAQKGTEILVIDGRTSEETRLAYRQRFGSKDPARLILLAQVKTMSLSVNELVTASHAIFASLSWQRDDLIQAMDRLHRIGQKLPVTAWFPLARGTVDEVIYKSHQAGTDLEADLLEHVGTLSDSGYRDRLLAI